MLRLIGDHELDQMEHSIQESQVIERVLTEYLIEGGATCREEELHLRSKLLHYSIEKILMKTGYCVLGKCKTCH